MRTSASNLAHQLQLYGVRHVFGIPGVHTLELYRGLAETTLRHITPRHEQGAGFMADAYARVSGEPGVCFIISGPGMTNIITAMGQAYSESIPMLVISAVNSHGRMGSGDGWLHELPDQQALVKGVCAFSHTVHHPDELDQVLARAFAVFDSQRPRPVHIEIPINVLQAAVTADLSIARKPLRLRPSVANSDEIERAARQLSDAERPLIMVGGGARHAACEILRLAEYLDAPVVMSVNGRGILSHAHPLAVPASASLSSVRTLISESDVVLAIGTEMGPTDIDMNEDGLFSLPEMFIRVDIDAQQIMRNQRPLLGLLGDSASTASALLLQLEKGTPRHSTGSARARTTNQQVLAGMSARDIHYLEVLACIRDTLPGVVMVGDSTQLTYAGNYAFGMTSPGSWFNSAMGFGTLGYALPAGIGAALADTERHVVAISGDGGLQFCLAELATAVEEGVRLTLIVHENGGYQEISKFMRADAIEPVGVDLYLPDLCVVADGCGWITNRLDSLQQFSNELGRAAAASKPTLIAIPDVLFDS